MTAPLMPSEVSGRAWIEKTSLTRPGGSERKRDSYCSNDLLPEEEAKGRKEEERKFPERRNVERRRRRKIGKKVERKIGRKVGKKPSLARKVAWVGKRKEAVTMWEKTALAQTPAWKRRE